jgi:hypothetical protein
VIVAGPWISLPNLVVLTTTRRAAAGIRSERTVGVLGGPSFADAVRTLAPPQAAASVAATVSKTTAVARVLLATFDIGPSLEATR